MCETFIHNFFRFFCVNFQFFRDESEKNSSPKMKMMEIVSVFGIFIAS